MEFSEFLSSKNLDKDIAMAQCHVGPFENFVGKRHVSALPIEEPERGLKGYVFFYTEESKEITLDISVRARPEVSNSTEIKTRSDLEKIYDKAVENKWILIPWENPQKLQLGFLVWNSDGVEKYWIKLMSLRNSSRSKQI